MEMVAQTINLLNGHDVDYNAVNTGEIETCINWSITSLNKLIRVLGLLITLQLQGI